MAKKDQALRIYEALRNPGVKNLDTIKSKLGNLDVTYVISVGDEEKDEEDVPIALILDDDTLAALDEELGVGDEDAEEDEEDEGDEESEEDGEDEAGEEFRP